MSNEPEKNIEQRLQEYAQQRRDEAGAPMELHAVNRKLLQDEVARTHASVPAAEPASPADTPSWFVRFWPRLSFGVAIFASLAFIVFAVYMDARLRRQVPASDRAAGDATRYYAKTEPQKAQAELHEARGIATAAAPVPSVAPIKADAAQDRVEITGTLGAADAKAKTESLARRSENEKLGMVAGQSLAEADTGKAMDQVGAARQLALNTQNRPEGAKAFNSPAFAPSPDLAAKSRLARMDADSSDRALKDTAIAPAAPPAPPPVALLPAGESKALAAPQTQAGAEATLGKSVAAANFLAGTSGIRVAGGEALRFKQTPPEVTYRRNHNSPPFPKVMTSFQLELAGDKVRITDTDGSTYDGQLTGSADTRGRSNGRGEITFEAKGRNRTLNQQVTFLGSFVTADVAELEARDEQAARKRAAGGPRPAVSTPATMLGGEFLRAGRQLQGTQIQGRVTVGGRSHFDIHAVTAP